MSLNSQELEITNSPSHKEETNQMSEYWEITLQQKIDTLKSENKALTKQNIV